MNVGLKMNLGPSIENVLPTVEDCLRDDAGEFYSTQNAIRLHEWLGGTSTLPPVLEKTNSLTKELVKRQLGTGQARYPRQMRVGDFIRLEQAKLAAGPIAAELKKLLNDSKEAKTPATEKAVTETADNMMRILYPIYHFNASCLFYGYELPKHMSLTSIDVLDLLVDFVITQRQRSIYQTNEKCDVPIAQNLYTTRDLEMVLVEMHRAAESNIFPAPKMVVQDHNLLSIEAFREMASAISFVCGYLIPFDWHCVQNPSKIFFWAQTVLLYKQNGVEEAVVRPKPKAAVLSVVKNS